jgi:hypothetical protein
MSKPVAELAEAELNVIVSEVLRVLPDYALRPGTVITHSPWTGRGPVSLPVTFTPSSATADAEVAS